MRVVISGGTGFVGKALCHALVGRGDEAVIFTRGPARDLSHACKGCGAGGKVALVSWTPEQPGAWQDAVDGADAVVHLAGASVTDERWTPERKNVLRSSRIASTELLTAAILRAKEKPKVFITASGVGHYGTKTGDRVLTEADPPGDDFLAELTQDWEAAAQPVAAAGVRVCSARLGLVLGRDGGVFGRLGPIFKAFVGGPIGDGDQYMPWVHLRDTVRALEAMLERADFSGAYNVVGPEPVTMNAFAEAFGSALHRPSLFRVPPFAVKAIMGTQAAEVLLTGQRAIPKRLVDAGFAFVFADLASALADLTSTNESD